MAAAVGVNSSGVQDEIDAPAFGAAIPAAKGRFILLSLRIQFCDNYRPACDQFRRCRRTVRDTRPIARLS